MKQRKQLGLFDPSASNKKRQQVYIPPEPDELDRYAERVCQGMQQQDSKPQHDLIRGFSTFMKLVVRIQAKHLNKGVQP